MDIQRLLQLRENRQSRRGEKPDPFNAVFDTIMQCLQAGNAIVDETVTSDHVELLERSVIISAVSAIEVYYRDMLDYLFRYCNPEFFEPHLKSLHQNKYGITDLLEVYRHRIHPLEIISGDMNFQNAEKIDKIFSKFLGGSLWSQVLNLQLRIKEEPEKIMSFNHEELEGLMRTFSLRHELVHDPSHVKFLNEAVMEDLSNALVMVFGANVILSDMISRNVDPVLKKENEKKNLV